MKKLEEIELFAWLGEDELAQAGTGEIGIKRGIVPAGDIPMVAISRDKMTQDYIVKQMQYWAKATGKKRMLCRFIFFGIEEETTE